MNQQHLLSKYARARFSVMLSIFMFSSFALQAQTNGCDEGVIRLPDRSGTIQICSALSAQVPQLGKQLSDVVKLLGTQQKQIEGLTELVKGLNGIGQNLSDERQAQLLVNLAKEIDRSSRRGEATSRRDLESLIDRVGELNGVMTQAASTPEGATEIRKAMSAETGLAVSRLEFGTALSQLEDISKQLKALGKGVTDIRQDTTAIRQDIQRIEAQSIEALKTIATEIRSLGGTGGLIDQPKTYPAIYHNARILAQRGEFDVAMQTYQKLFSFPLQMADPIADVVTLARRLYGVNGAQKFMEQNLKTKMPLASYLYAQLLMVTPSRVSQFNWETLSTQAQWLSASQEFPPLALQLLKMEKPHRESYSTYPWFEWKFYFDLNNVVEKSTSNGDFLAYFVDQIRGGGQVDEYSQENMSPFFQDLFLFVLPNPDMPKNSADFERNSKYSFAEKGIGQYRVVDLEKSPVVIDTTYYAEAPVPIMWSGRSQYYFEWLRYPDAPKRENGLIRLSLWEPFIDTKQPIELCAKDEKNVEKCLNVNSAKFSCNGLKGMNAGSERFKCFSVYESENGSSKKLFSVRLPKADTTFSTKDWLNSKCLSQVKYTDGSGIKISIPAKDMVSTHRWAKGRNGNSTLEDFMRSCGYQVQTTEVAPKGAAPMNNTY